MSLIDAMRPQLRLTPAPLSFDKLCQLTTAELLDRHRMLVNKDAMQSALAKRLEATDAELTRLKRALRKAKAQG